MFNFTIIQNHSHYKFKLGYASHKVINDYNSLRVFGYSHSSTLLRTQIGTHFWRQIAIYIRNLQMSVLFNKAILPVQIHSSFPLKMYKIYMHREHLHRNIFYDIIYNRK